MENKLVVIVGVLDKQGSSNLWIASSFLQRGYQVIPVNYRTIITNNGQIFLKTYLLEIIKNYNPSLVLFCKCNGVDPNTIVECSKLTKTYLFFMDLYSIASRSPEIIEHAKNTHFSSCTSEITVEFFQKCGVKNCYHVFEGADPNVHKPVEIDDKYKNDIAFITNTLTGEKEEYCNYLLNNNIDFKVYNNFVSPKEWSKIHSSSKYMLSMGTFNNIPTYFSGRLFETLACGVCTFQVDNTGTLGKYFKDNEEVIFVKSKEDLVERIHLLSEEDRIKIAINGREKVLRSYTWHHTVANILHIVGI